MHVLASLIPISNYLQSKDRIQNKLVSSIWRRKENITGKEHERDLNLRIS